MVASVKQVMRVHWNVHRNQYTIRTQVPDRAGRPYWKNKAYRKSLVLKNVYPHFYRGTQKKVQSGEMEKTPFAFLEGDWFNPDEIDWEQYSKKGLLLFDPDCDQDFVWDSPYGRLVISPENGLPDNAILYLTCSEEDDPFSHLDTFPFQEVYLPL